MVSSRSPSRLPNDLGSGRIENDPFNFVMSMGSKTSV